MFKNKKILFVLSHLDDETFGFGGMLNRLKIDNDIHFMVMCKGRDEANSKARLNTFMRILVKYNITKNDFYLGEEYDMEIDNILLKNLTEIIQENIDKIQPDIIITNSYADLHQDHQKVSHAVKICCRRKVAAELYELHIPGCEPFPSKNFEKAYFDTSFKLTDEEFQIKNEMCKMYSTEKFPDIQDHEYLRTVYRRF